MASVAGLPRCVLVFLLWASCAVAALNLPPLTGRVVDQTGTLSPTQRAALEERLAAHEQATSNQVVVATVPSLQSVDVEQFANSLFRAWRLGQAGRDNGVLLLVAPNEREVRIEVGYGLEGTLTDAIGSDIVRNRILPRFRAGDLPGGITAGVEAILAAIDGTYEPMPRKPIDAPATDWLVLPIALFLFFLFLRSRMGFRGPRARRRWGYGSGWGYGPGWGYGAGRWGGGTWGGGSSSGVGFSGGGGSSGGGGASGRW